jgi:hypothetical protein
MMAMNRVEIAKTCMSCGVDLEHQDCVLTQGGYRCLTCYEASKSQASGAPTLDSLKSCVLCGASVERKDCHKNRYGKYVCRKCKPSEGRTWRRFFKKPFRWLTHTYDRILIWMVYVCFIICCLLLFYALMARITAPPVLD